MYTTYDHISTAECVSVCDYECLQSNVEQLIQHKTTRSIPVFVVTTKKKNNSANIINILNI